MRKMATAVVLVGTLIVPATTEAAPTPRWESNEACEAFNPGQPKCSFEATHSGGTPVTGVAGVGSWIVKIKRGKDVTVIKSPASGEPTAVSFNFAAGDKVTAVAKTPGTALAVGHPD